MKPEKRLFIRGIFHGITGAGLFHRTTYREPDEFIDSRPLQDVIASGDFDRTFTEGLAYAAGAASPRP